MRRLLYLSGAPRVTTDPQSPAGGPRSHVLGMIEAFTAAGWDVDRYIAGDTRWAKRVAGGSREAAVRGNGRWKAAAADLVRIGAEARNRRVVSSAIVAGTHDLAYERFASFNSLGLAAQRAGIPWVLETSGPFFHEAKVERGTMALTSVARRRELAAYRACDLLVCVSNDLREFLADEGVPVERTTVLRNGVDVRRFDPARHPTEPPRHLTIGFVGTVLEWQGLDLLLEAVASVIAGGEQVKVVVVGDGRALPELRQLVDRLDLAESVRFVGQVPSESIPGLIAGFDLGFAGHVPRLGGRMYHSPLKLYEYMAMGKPVLSSAFPDAENLVASSGEGLLFEPGNVRDLERAIADAIVDRARLRERADAIREHVRRHESWDSRLADLMGELTRRGLLPAPVA